MFIANPSKTEGLVTPAWQVLLAAIVSLQHLTKPVQAGTPIYEICDPESQVMANQEPKLSIDCFLAALGPVRNDLLHYGLVHHREEELP